MTTKYWVGGAVTIEEQWTVTFTGTFVQNDTVSITVNNKTLTLTLADASRLSLANVATDFAAMINGNSANGSETRSALGSEVGEFATWSAAASGATVVITGDDDGRPMGTLTVSDYETSTGTSPDTGTGGADMTIAKTRSGVGPYTWDVASNWSSNAVPGAGDDVIFDYRAANGVKYNLDQSSVTVDNIYVRDSYKYGIGLPAVNTDTATLPYGEHLTQYLTLDGVGSGSGVVKVDNPMGSSIKIDAGDTATDLIVYGTGSSVDDAIPACDLKVNHASAELHVLGGDVGLCTADGATGEVSAITMGRGSGATLTIGGSPTVPTIDLSGGTLRTKASHATINQSGGTLHQLNNTLTTLNLNGGTAKIYSNSTITTVNMTDGTLDFSVDSRTKTVTNMNMYALGAIKDPQGVVTWTNGLDVYGTINDVTLDFPARRTWSLSTI